jgi:hypothetical protein
LFDFWVIGLGVVLYALYQSKKLLHQSFFISPSYHTFPLKKNGPSMAVVYKNENFKLLSFSMYEAWKMP